MTALAAVSLLIWCWLLTMHGQFWRAGPVLPAAVPSVAPPVAIVVPARDEAQVIGRAVRSLVAQDYRGPFSITVVDDRSEDGTGAIVTGIADSRVTMLRGDPRPPGRAVRAGLALVQILRQFRCRAVPPVWILVQALQTNVFEIARGLRLEPSWRHRLLRTDLIKRFHRRDPLERRLARQHFIENACQRVLICRGSHTPLRVCLFGAHVQRRSHWLAACGQPLILARERQC